MIDPRSVCLFVPSGLAGFKQKLFNRIAQKVGRSIRGDVAALAGLPGDVIPIVGCSPELTDLINQWRFVGRRWIYWDRGYARRVFATDLPRGENGGYYRWHIDGFQMADLRDVPDDRWDALKIEVHDWRRDGTHILVADPSPTYCRFHRCEGWLGKTVETLKRLTKRRIVVRDKEMQRRASDRMPGGRRLWDDLVGAHCLVTHGSIAAVEAVIYGCPVFVDHSSAAALVGQTDLLKIEQPAYPDRCRWLNSLAYCQFNEEELVNGVLWRLIR